MVAAAEAVFNRVVLSVGWFALGGTAAFLSGGFVALCPVEEEEEEETSHGGKSIGSHLP